MHIARVLVVFVAASLALSASARALLAQASAHAPHARAPVAGTSDGQPPTPPAVRDHAPAVDAVARPFPDAIATDHDAQRPPSIVGFDEHTGRPTPITARTRGAHGARAPPAATD